MKARIALSALALLLLSMTAVAQDHGEAGVYGEYFRFQGIKANLAGVGGRLSLNTSKRFKLEAELGYDFRRGFAESFNNGIGLSSSRSSVRILHGLFGPTMQTNVGKARAFITVKGGFFNTEVNGQPPGPGFTSQINSLRVNNVNAVAYPGGGVEGYLGPIGLRLDLGDEIVFVSGHANHNFRMTFGPHIRF